jgi:plastocyanin
MYNELDSRALGRADCYAQRFMRIGDYHYNIVPGHGQALSTDYPFVIHVDESGKKAAKMTQHSLRVTPSGNGFTVAPATLTIAVGDMVVWNGGGDIPFAVVGDQDFFNSHKMVNECGFSHAFGTAGEYHWRDAFGSELAGVVRVRDPDCRKDPDLKKWREALSKGNLVMINDGKADQTELDIYTGQTVFFALVKTSGISITDSRLLEHHYEADCVG